MKKKKSNTSWIIKITIFAFILAMTFSLLSDFVFKDANIYIGIIAIIFFILIALVFDIIALSITYVDMEPLNSLSSKKVKGANITVILKKNMEKITTLFCDVIGDVCGIITGSLGVVISTQISLKFNMSFLITTVLITSIIAALTILCKAMNKVIAIKNSTKIILSFSRILSLFYTPKKK